MIEFGHFCLALALFFALVGTGCGIGFFVRRTQVLLLVGRNALVAVFLCVMSASLCLWWGLVHHDFSVQYIYQHSATDMPPLYILTAFWSALEGSHLLWTLLLALICAVSACTVAPASRGVMPSLCVVYGASMTFMLLLAVSVSAPFTRLFPAGELGRGMNALLQNPYMAIHPPLLFTGYSLLVVPFAYAIGALLQGDLGPAWLATVRRYSLLAWAFLTTAIFLGGKWAYFELGWGGYWAWDPVENSSFLPWIALTASLHTLLVYGKTQRLPRLGLFLCLLAFILSFEGTLLTRSGMISSVHAFAQSTVGTAYVVWVVLLLGGSLGLLAWRSDKLRAVSSAWSFSKETILLFALFFFLFLLAFVLMGTLLPLITEALGGGRISVQQPFFNAFAPWVGLAFVLLLGVGNLMRWKRGHLPYPLYTLVLPAVGALVLAVVLAQYRGFAGLPELIRDRGAFRITSLVTHIAYVLILWTALVLIADLVCKLKASQWDALGFLKTRRSYLGALLVHQGFLMALLGFAGNWHNTAADVVLPLHQSTVFHGYTLRNQGLSYDAFYNVQRVAARIDATLPEHSAVPTHPVVILPARSQFSQDEQWFHDVGVYSTVWHDIYLVLMSFDLKTEEVSLRLNYNPTVKLVWTSLLVMLAGIVVSLSHRVRWPASVGDAHQGQRVLSVGLILLVTGATVFAYTGVFAGQNPGDEKAQPVPGAVTPTYTDPRLAAIASDLRCPTCLGLSVLESQTPQSVAMRREIQRLLAEGQSKEQILQHFVARYGDWVLRAPNQRSSWGFAAWAVPAGLLVLGPCVLGVVLWRQGRSRKGGPSC